MAKPIDKAPGPPWVRAAAGPQGVRGVANMDERRWQRTRDKFMQLLNIDRGSPQFLPLYEEVDAMLTCLVQEHARAKDVAEAQSEADAPSVPLTKLQQM